MSWLSFLWYFNTHTNTHTHMNTFVHMNVQSYECIFLLLHAQNQTNASGREQHVCGTLHTLRRPAQFTPTVGWLHAVYENAIYTVIVFINFQTTNTTLDSTDGVVCFYDTPYTILQPRFHILHHHHHHHQESACKGYLHCIECSCILRLCNTFATFN